MKTICVDAHTLSIFGMGSVLRQLLYLFREQPILWRALVNRDCKDLLKKAARLSHAIITSSAFSKQAICKYTVHESKVRVIPLAVDKAVFSPISNLAHAKQILSENYQLKKIYYM